MALYLLLSIVGAATSSALMVTINNLYYFGMTQFLPGHAGHPVSGRMRPSAIIAGILAGDGVAIRALMNSPFPWAASMPVSLALW